MTAPEVPQGRWVVDTSHPTPWPWYQTGIDKAPFAGWSMRPSDAPFSFGVPMTTEPEPTAVYVSAPVLPGCIVSVTWADGTPEQAARIKAQIAAMAGHDDFMVAFVNSVPVTVAPPEVTP